MCYWYRNQLFDYENNTAWVYGQKEGKNQWYQQKFPKQYRNNQNKQIDINFDRGFAACGIYHNNLVFGGGVKKKSSRSDCLETKNVPIRIDANVPLKYLKQCNASLSCEGYKWGRARNAKEPFPTSLVANQTKNGIRRIAGVDVKTERVKFKNSLF